MSVHVEISGVLRRPTGDRALTVDVSDPLSATELIAKLGYDERERRALRLSRDGTLLKPSDMIQDGDQLILLAPIGGG